MSRPSRKRFKKTHGPDFVENYDSSFEEPELKCDYCRLTAKCNREGKSEALLICKDCNSKAHPSCMDYSCDLAERSRMSPWQCIDCKTCYICEDSEDADSMLFCDSCDKGFHMGCHQPKILEKPVGNWVCQRCKDEMGKAEPSCPDDVYGINIVNVVSLHKKNNGVRVETTDASEVGPTKCTIDGESGLPTPCDSPVPDAQQNKSHYNGNSFYGIPNSVDGKESRHSSFHIPDATNWSIQDVEKYLCSVGFAEQAKVFKDQEIDGKSLLLMKRSDVLSGLALKLGPALKIYTYVKRLQMKHVDDETDF